MLDGFLHAVALRRGESPMPTFGHPEVYICVAFRCIFSLSFNMLGLVVNLSLKALFPDSIRKHWVGSGKESPLRALHMLEKVGQASTNTRRLTKLIHDDCSILIGACFQCSKGAPILCFLSSMYQRTVATNVSHFFQNVYTPNMYVMQRAKLVNRGKYGNTRYPKVRKGYNLFGYGALIRGNDDYQRRAGIRTYAKKTDITDYSSVRLSKHKEENLLNLNKMNNKLIHLIGDLSTLILAYELIKSNPGQMTKGSTNETLDGIDLPWFENTAKLIKAGKYRFSPSRRVYIPKPGKAEKRPLTIGTPRDKVVQKAIQLVLEPIFEPTFLENSNGFRPSRGCHSALKLIKNWFHGVTWVIESDISECFPTVKHDILISLLKKRISCDKTIALINNLLKAGYIDLGIFCKGKMGVSQGSILSPLLCNIYLHELDEFLYKLKKDFSSSPGTRRRKNPVYRQIQYRIRSPRYEDEKKLYIKTLRTLHSKDLMDPNFRKLFYVRYADDFIIGVTGSNKEAREILSKVQSFLSNSLKMDLSYHKTSIVNFKKKTIFFLGTKLYGISRSEKPLRIVKKPLWNTSIRVRITPRVGMHAPIEKILTNLYQNKFLKRNKLGIFKPTALRRVVNFDHADILGYYNSISRGILNYYSFADNFSRMNAIVKYHLLHSCALTLALKYKLRYRAKAFKRFGSKLKCPDTDKEFFIPKDFRRTNSFLINPLSIDSTISRKWNNKLTKSSLLNACVICGATPVEMHHIRKISDLRTKYDKGEIDFYTMQMAGINRKQVPLCRTHHKVLHQNKLTEAEKIAFAEGVKNLNL